MELTVRQCILDLSEDPESIWLSKRETKAIMTALVGLRPSKFEVERLFATFGQVREESGERSLAKTELERVMAEKMAVMDKDDLVRQTFRAFDSKCRGFLTFEDVLCGFQLAMKNISPKVVLDAFRIADRDGDGRIGYAEFVRITQDIKF